MVSSLRQMVSTSGLLEPLYQHIVKPIGEIVIRGHLFPSRLVFVNQVALLLL